MSQDLMTPEEVRAHWCRTGTSMRQWARSHGVSPFIVSRVLSGRCKARIGEGHKIAVLLRLKDGVILEVAETPEG